MSFLEKYQNIISQSINNFIPDGEPSELYEPMKYILHLGGKRLRPVILLMAYNLFREDIEKAIKPALGIEFFHNFSLIHDDIMDQAPLRRNKKTVHVKYNENTAILSGDALFVKSFQMLEDLEPSLFKPCFELFSKTALEVCEGQQYDMNFETRKEISFEEYIHMITGKTAVLCACAIKMGAIIAKTDKENSDNLYEFGKYLGIAFQLMDDYLDVFGNERMVGKKHAGDIYENKKTILFFLALKRGDEKQIEKLNYWFSIKDDSNTKVNEVINIFKELEVDKMCLELVDSYTNLAKEYLNKVKVSSEKKQSFFELIDYLLLRES